MDAMGYIQHGLQIVATKRFSLASQWKERQDRRQSLGKHSKISHGLPMILNGEEFPITWIIQSVPESVQAVGNIQTSKPYL